MARETTNRYLNERAQIGFGALAGMLAASPFLMAMEGLEGRTAGDGWMLAIGAAVGTGACAALWRIIPSNLRLGMCTGLVVLGTFAGWSVLERLNRSEEPKPVEDFRAYVVDKHISTSRHSTFHTVRFAPVEWSKSPESLDDENLYEQVKVGDPICGDLHTGMLGWRWWVLKSCSDPAPIPVAPSAT